MERFDPSALADYLITLLAIGFALERLVPRPNTVAMRRVIAGIRDLEGWASARVPPLHERGKVWTELALLGAALAIRVAALGVWQMVRS